MPAGSYRPAGDFHSAEIGDPKLPFEVADRRAAQSAYAVHRRHLHSVGNELRSL